MTPEEMQELERRMLDAPMPGDAGGSRGGTGSRIGKWLHLETKMTASGGLLLAGYIILFFMAVHIAGMFPAGDGTNPADRTDSIEGFGYLREAGESKTYGAYNGTVSGMGPGETQAAGNNYYVNPSIAAASVTDSLFQLEEKVYRLPVSIAELEADGILLVTLGSQPPDEQVLLSPQTRNGYIQAGSSRYPVVLENGMECSYHSLTVCGITANVRENTQGCAFYACGGLTLGSEEADIPPEPDKMGQDAMGVYTFYTFGGLTGEMTKTGRNHSGRQTVFVTENGKITEISMFDDATVAGAE